MTSGPERPQPVMEKLKNTPSTNHNRWLDMTILSRNRVPDPPFDSAPESAIDLHVTGRSGWPGRTPWRPDSSAAGDDPGIVTPPPGLIHRRGQDCRPTDSTLRRNPLTILAGDF